MKFLNVIFFLSTSCTAFAPSSRKASFITSPIDRSKPNTILFADKVPFFASEDEETSVVAPTETSSTSSGEVMGLDSMTEEEEVEMLVQKELIKKKKVSKLNNAKGQEYAPWMNEEVSDAEITQIRQLIKEKTSARRARTEQEKSVSGNLYLDSQAQELSGTGLITKIIDGKVELEWATRREKGSKGFIVRKRPAKTEEFYVVASYKDCAPLMSKGEDGGIYRYYDESSEPGGWVYRISEADTSGNESDICQCLVEVQTEGEQKAALFAGVGIIVLGIAAVGAGIYLDPMGGY